MSSEGISLVIPTYKEVLNITPLTKAIDAVLNKKYKYEILIVDDNSNDGSEDMVKDLQGQGYPIRIHVRKNERGLSSAVVKGFEEAKYDIFVVMDADLQHDPKFLPSVVDPIISREADFVVGSRNVGGGVVEDWPLVRRIISWGATNMARPLTSITDPMSGFFSLRRETFKKAKTINAVGYKIGLELIVRCGCRQIKEVPIVFRDREHGESKLTMKQNLLYVRQLISLYWAKYPLLIVLFFLIFFAALYYTFKLLF